MRESKVAKAKAQPKMIEKALTREETVIRSKSMGNTPYERDTDPRDTNVRIWEGKVYLADDFDEWPAELLKAFTIDEAPCRRRADRSLQDAL